MGEVIDLEPTPFEPVYIARTASEAVHLQDRQSMRDSLSAAVIALDFDPAAVIPSFHAVADQSRDVVIGKALDFEARGRHPEDEPMHLHLLSLGAVAVGGKLLRDYGVGDAFMEQLHSDLDQIDPTQFALLGTLRGELDKTPKLLALIQDIDRLSGDSSHADWAAHAFALVEDAAKYPDGFTASIVGPHADALYLIAFMPNVTRQLTRRLIVGNALSGALEEKFSRKGTDTELEAVNAFRRYYATDALTGQQWDTVLDHADPAVAESITRQMAQYSAQHLEALADLQRLHGDPAAQKVFTFWGKMTTALNKRMSSLTRTSGLNAWQQQDVGHCFERFQEIELTDALDSAYALSYGEHEKSEAKALILEDDDRQMKTTARIVDHHTSYITDPTLQFQSLDGIDETLDSPDIGAYYLDIQIGDDSAAGVRVAEALLRRISVRFGQGDDRPVKIILWTTSKQVGMAAQHYFDGLFASEQSLQPERYSHFGRYRRQDGLPVDFDIRLKHWKIQDAR